MSRKRTLMRKAIQVDTVEEAHEVLRTDRGARVIIKSSDPYWILARNGIAWCSIRAPKNLLADAKK